MLKNITLSADEQVIKKAREKALKCNRSLNSIFREWLRNFVNQENIHKYEDFMKKIDYAQSGKKFSRDEMNER